MIWSSLDYYINNEAELIATNELDQNYVTNFMSKLSPVDIQVNPLRSQIEWDIELDSDILDPKFVDYLLLANPQRSQRPVSERLQCLEQELSEAFLAAGFDDFVHSNTVLGNRWRHESADPNSTVTNLLTDFIKVDLGLSLSAHYLLQDVPAKTFTELVPRLKEALVYQETNRLVAKEVGIKNTAVTPHLRLNPNKGQGNSNTLDLDNSRREQLLRKIAKEFDIDPEKLIGDFNKSEWASISCLWDAVLEQVNKK